MQSAYQTGDQWGSVPKWLIWGMLSFFPILGIGLIGLGIFAILNGAAVWIFVVLAGIAWFLCYLCWCYCCKGFAKYRFENEGLVVKFPLCQEERIPWNDFQQVCVIHAAYTTRGERKANTVICCVKKGEKKDFYDRWKTDNPFRYRTVICIEYTPELHQGIIEKCPYEVADLRTTLAYRLEYDTWK